MKTNLLLKKNDVKISSNVAIWAADPIEREQETHRRFLPSGCFHLPQVPMPPSWSQGNLPMPPIQDFFSFLPFLHIHHCQNIHYHFIFYSDDHTTQPAPGKSLAPQYRGLLLLELSVSTTWIRLHPGFHLIICWQLVLIHFFFFFSFPSQSHAVLQLVSTLVGTRYQLWPTMI